MACRGPSDSECRREDAVSAVAKHIVYLYTELGHPTRIPAYVKEAAKNAWNHMDKFDEMTAFLCETIQTESVHDVHAIMYNGRKAKSRALADWWEAHQKLDEAREAAEARDQKRQDVIDSLTDEQREVLNL